MNILNMFTAQTDCETNFMRTIDIIIFVIFVGTITTIFGYHFGTSNHTEELPKVLRLLNPHYLAQDFFVNATTGFDPRFFYSRLLATLGTFIWLPVLYLLLTWLINVSVTLITYLITRDFFHGSNFIAMIASALVMSVASISPGGEASLFAKMLIPLYLAMPFCLLSLWAGIRRRPILCGLLALFASFIHPLVAVMSGMVGLGTMGISILLDINHGIKNNLKKIAIEMSTVVITAIILAVFTLIIWIIPQKTFLESRQFIALLSFRAPHHYIPSTFGLHKYVTTIAFLLGFFISWKWWHDDPQADKRLARDLLIAIIIVLGLFVGGYVFVEIFPSRFWATLQAFRYNFIIRWLGLIVFARTIVYFLQKGGSYSGWLFLIGSGPIQPLFMLLGHVVDYFRKRVELILPIQAVNLGLGLVLLAASIALMEFGSIAESNSLFLFAFITFWFLTLPKRWYRRFVPILLMCLIISMFAVNRYQRVPFLSFYLDRYQPIITLQDSKGPDVETAIFSREKTSADAVFLTPPFFDQFRLIAQRATVVDFKNLSFKDRALVEWKERLLNCYGQTKSRGGISAGYEMDRMYKKTTDAQLRVIVRKYQISYAVLYRETPSAYPVVFENDKYKIIQI